MKYKTIFFATTNSAKVTRIKNLFKDAKFRILTLKDLGYSIVEPEETQNSCVKIAEAKAKHYWDQLIDKYPVLTQDDTIKFYDVDEKDQPGLSIKSPVIKKYGKFSEESAIQFYTDLASKYGGEIKMSFNYGHAIYDGKVLKGSFSKVDCKLVNKVSKKLVRDYFLSSIVQVHINGTWKYYSELNSEEVIQAN